MQGHSDIVQWHAHSPQASQTLVLPDGCHDLILRVPAAGRPRWLGVALMDQAAWVSAQAGEQFIGFRLKPWVQVDKSAIVAALQRRAHPDPNEAKVMLGSAMRADSRVTEALQALAQTSSLSAACRSLDVAERSLQRLISQQTARTPGYWRSLARLRRSARALHSQAALPWPDLAAEQGFADQAHLCREFRRWFGCTPQQFRARPDWIAQACAPGFED